MALAVVSSGYLCTVNGAAEPITKKSAFHLRILIYMCQKSFNERQKDLVEIGRYYCLTVILGSFERKRLSLLFERGTLTPQEVSIAIRQLYSAAGLKQMNAALAAFEQLREERPEFGVDYDKLVPKRVGLSAC